MEKDAGEIFRELKKDLSAYVELKLELLKLNTYERTGKVIAVLSYGVILLFLAFFAILFIFLALGFFLGDLFGSVGSGFGVVAVLYLLLIGIIVMNKDRISNKVLNVDENEITMETTFTDDLGADSLDVFQIIMGLEEEFDIEIANEDAEKIVTVGDAVEQIKNALA